MATSLKEIQKQIAKKRRAGQLPPQRCTNPRCLTDLSDPTVPSKYEAYRLMFGLAVERVVELREGQKPLCHWECPACGTVLGRGKHVATESAETYR